MMEMLKSLFGKKKKKVYVPDPPGRTFKRIETGRYFGCEDINADENSVAKAKQRKIEQITELELVPMFIRYSYEDTSKNKQGIQAGENLPDPEVSSVHVVFQKEVTAEKWNMTHVTEISFIVNRSDFKEFEKMSGVSLNNDFRDLTSYGNTAPDNEKERRKKKRDT
jgi:hypothetical protein